MDTASDLFCGDTPAPQSPDSDSNDPPSRNPNSPRADDGRAGIDGTDSEMVNTVDSAVEEPADADMETASLLFYNETPVPQNPIPCTTSGGTGEQSDFIPERVKSPSGALYSSNAEVEPPMNIVSDEDYTTDRVPSGVSEVEMQDDPYAGAKTPGNIDGPLHMTVDDYTAALIATAGDAGDTTEEDEDYTGVRTPGAPGHASTYQSNDQVHSGNRTSSYPVTYQTENQEYAGAKTPEAGYRTAYQTDSQDYAGARTPGSTLSVSDSGHRDNAAAYRQSIYDRMNDYAPEQGRTSLTQHGQQRYRAPARPPSFAEPTMNRRPRNDPMSPGNYALSSGSRTPGSRFAVSSIRDNDHHYNDDLGDDASTLGDDASAFGNEDEYGTYRYNTAPRGLNDYRPNYNLGRHTNPVDPFKVPARPASSYSAAPLPVDRKGKAPAARTPPRKAVGSTTAAAASAPARRASGARTPGARTPAARTPMQRAPAAKTSGARTPARTVPGAKTPSQKTLSNLMDDDPNHGSDLEMLGEKQRYFDDDSDDEGSQYSNATRKSMSSSALPKKSVPAKRKRATPVSDGDDFSGSPTPKKRASGQRKTAASKTPNTSVTGQDFTKKRAPPRNGKIVDNKPIPRSFDECDEADQALIIMRENNVDWKTVKKRYCEITGEDYGKSTLPNRYERLMTNFIIIRDEDNVPLMEAKKEIEDEFDEQKWDLIAQRIVDRSGGTYDGITLQRHFKRLMLSQGFNVNDGMASTDPDFRSGGTPEHEDDEDSDGNYQE